MSAPRVYAAISAITAELARTGIAKTRLNAAEQYAYRSIDDVCAALAPLLAEQRLCMLPRVLARTCEERRTGDGSVWQRVSLQAAFDLVSARDGSTHVVETFGEALDASDKATAKAMSAAYKQAVLQTFCVPVAGMDDAEAVTPALKLGSTDAIPDPVQGWEQWSCDLQELVRGCQSGEALDRVQATYKPLLRAVSSREPHLYAAIGETLQERRRALSPPAAVLHVPQQRTQKAAELAHV